MFKQFYCMTMNPFEKGVKEKDAYFSKDLKEMIARLEYLDEVRGIGVFTAPAGSGKTFALRCFDKQVNPNLTRVICLCLTTVTITEFYRQFCISLGLEPSSRKSHMFRDIKDFMERMSRDKRIHYILVWDEAQYLSSDILRDLKLLMNFSMDSKDCFSLVLVGQPVLNNILSKQIHESLSQRIVINYNFEGLSEEETIDYIKSRLALAGGSSQIFDDNALLAAFKSSTGSIRRLNLILSKALTIAAQHEKANIDTEVIMAATNEIYLP